MISFQKSNSNCRVIAKLSLLFKYVLWINSIVYIFSELRPKTGVTTKKRRWCSSWKANGQDNCNRFHSILMVLAICAAVYKLLIKPAVITASSRAVFTYISCVHLQIIYNIHVPVCTYRIGDKHSSSYILMLWYISAD